MKADIIKTVVSAVVFMALSANAVDVSWNGGGGDKDLGNAANWGGTLPQGSDYKATLSTASTAENPYVMETGTLLTPNEIVFGRANTVFDLGAGNEFTALFKFHYNVDSTLTLKSGILGVNYDSASGERFFLGDNSYDGGRIVVDGPDAMLTSSKKNTIQVGTNKKNYTLEVKNGGTVKGNVIIGNGGGANGNKMTITGQGSRHWTPSNSTATALTVGNSGKGALVDVSDYGAITNESAKEIMIGCFYNGTSLGQGVLKVRDHASLYSQGTVWVGRYSYTNLFEVSGAAVATTKNIYLGGNSLEKIAGSEPGYGNVALFTGAGTKHLIPAGGTISVGNKNSYANEVRYEEGAVGDFLKAKIGVGSNVDKVLKPDSNEASNNASNNVFYVGTNSSVVSCCYDDNADGFYGIELGTNSSDVGNRFIVDHGYFAITNSGTYENNSVRYACKQSVRIGKYGRNNSFEVINGGEAYFTNVNFQISAFAGSKSNTVVVTGGSKMTIVSPANLNLSAMDARKSQLYFGNNAGGEAGLLVDDHSKFTALYNIIRFNYHSWMRVSNCSTVDVYRIIAGEGAGANWGNRIEVDDSTLYCRYGALQLGTDMAYSTNHFCHIHGPNTYVYVHEGVNLSPYTTLKFTVDKGGFRTDGPVLKTPMGLSFVGSKQDYNHAKIVIDVAPNMLDSGIYKLIQTGDNKLNWNNIDLEYDPSLVSIVTKNAKELTIKVKSRRAFMMFVR